MASNEFADAVSIQRERTTFWAFCGLGLLTICVAGYLAYLKFNGLAAGLWPIGLVLSAIFTALAYRMHSVALEYLLEQERRESNLVLKEINAVAEEYEVAREDALAAGATKRELDERPPPGARRTSS